MTAHNQQFLGELAKPQTIKIEPYADSECGPGFIATSPALDLQGTVSFGRTAKEAVREAYSNLREWRRLVAETSPIVTQRQVNRAERVAVLALQLGWRWGGVGKS